MTLLLRPLSFSPLLSPFYDCGESACFAERTRERRQRTARAAFIKRLLQEKKSWRDGDELSCRVSVSLYKALALRKGPTGAPFSESPFFFHGAHDQRERPFEATAAPEVPCLAGEQEAEPAAGREAYNSCGTGAHVKTRAAGAAGKANKEGSLGKAGCS